MMRLFAVLLLGIIGLSGAEAQWRSQDFGRNRDQAGSDDARGVAGRFDFYVLSLSWSATFCEVTGNRRGSSQCDGGNPGFVLHGLWPQYERGFPSSCGPQGRNPTRDAMERAMRVFPEASLARHEWQKHGTCSGLSPVAYFEAAGAAKAKVKIPAALEAPERPSKWDIIAIERAFVDANPGLRTDMIAVTCQRGMLQEVRVCLSKDLRNFQTCQEVRQKSCRTRNVTVPSTR